VQRRKSLAIITKKTVALASSCSWKKDLTKKWQRLLVSLTSSGLLPAIGAAQGSHGSYGLFHKHAGTIKR
jgi:hypothetical protein